MDEEIFGDPPCQYTIDAGTLRERLLDPAAARAWVDEHPHDPLVTSLLRILGDLDGALVEGRARVAALEADSPRWAAAVVRLGHVHHWRGEFDNAYEMFARAAEVFRRSGDDRMLAVVHQHRAKALFDEGCLAEALGEAREAVRLREGHTDDALLASARLTCARIEPHVPPAEHLVR